MGIWVFRIVSCGYLGWFLVGIWVFRMLYCGYLGIECIDDEQSVNK